MAEKTHSKVGASSCYRWWECPGSIRQSQNLIPVKSAYADEGTAAHEVCEVSLKNWSHPEEVLGKKTSLGIEVDEDMVNAAEVLMEEIADDFFKHFGFNPKQDKIKDYLFVERSFDLSHLHPGMFGTNDACLLIPFTVLYVYDFKYGQGIAVEADNNKQLMYYALGALEGHDDINDIELVIVQPRAFHPKGPVRRWRTTRAELMAFKKELIDRAKQTEDPNAPIRPGEWCKFCPSLAVCKAVQQKAVTLAKADFAKPSVAAKLPEPQHLTVSELAQVLSNADLLTDWVKGVEAYAQGLLEAGRQVPGFKLVRKKTNRKWLNEPAVITRLAGLIKREEMFETKLRSPAQLEKLVGKDALDGLTVFPDAGPTIAPMSDKRDSLAPANAVADFKKRGA